MLEPLPLRVTVEVVQLSGAGGRMTATGGVVFSVTVTEAVAVQPLTVLVTVSV